MSFSEGLLHSYWLIGGALIYCMVLFYAIRNAPWSTLGGNRTLQHMLFGATALLMVLWFMRAGISPGLGIHFLGLTIMTLVFGWDLAILSATVALIGMAVVGKESWDGLLLSGVCSVLLPVASTWLLHRFVEAKMMKNFFVFLFVCGFLGAGLSAAVAGLSASAILVLDGVYTVEKIIHEYVRYLPLIMFPEGLMNGIFLTGMLVFHPDWVRTFDAKVYIDDQ
ncbi:energy-coupling factor ABC transporter permease [Neptuniibacter sp. QD37_11]|uniref:energy-coupling factor ABC transporter permease n=1 Tax=Neptuniibacter sp. QD37_11 TaxID=3398209 RepID=UPI0039F6305D